MPDAFRLDTTSLLKALNFEGSSGTIGAARTLLRTAVAALLNSAHPDVDYPRTAARVIAAVNTALASGNRATMVNVAAALDTDNDLGCPLS